MKRIIRRTWTIRRGCAMVMLAGSLASGAASAQAVDSSTSDPSASHAIPTEISNQVRFRKMPGPPDKFYPIEERKARHEGWTIVDMMIDPTGKPYDVVATESSGNRVLENAAVKYAETWEFAPPTVNGKPSDVSFKAKVSFGVRNGISKEFATAYSDLAIALQAKDRSAADAAMSKLASVNSQEDVYVGLAKYGYANLWGTQEEQLAGLQKAIGWDSGARFLPADQYRGTLISRFYLQAKTRDFAGAMKTWDTLQKLDVDRSARDAMQSVVDEIAKVRIENRPYDISAQLDDNGSWSLDLFRRQFRIAVSSGRISEIKLHCKQQYISFKFDPALEYRVSDKVGDCSIYLNGEVQTKFRLTQF